MIGIVDYGCGNLGSIANMLRKVGAKSSVVRTADEINAAEKLILPGVGHYDQGMSHLNEAGLRDALEKRVLGEGVPILGVCLGMQLLLEKSEEGSEPGLGWVPGRNIRFRVPQGTKLRIPHMGWSEVEPEAGTDLLSGFESTPRFYFVHSYHAADVPDDSVAATADYGGRFVCALQHRNIYATQFHPEKSHRYGLHVFQRFAELTTESTSCPSPA